MSEISVEQSKMATETLASFLRILCFRFFPRILLHPFFSLSLSLSSSFLGDGQVDFDEFMTILGPKLVSSEGRDGFLGNTIDSIFWQVSGKVFFMYI